MASVDGVGTKVMIARMPGRYDTVGQDLVNHCVDDILVQGAEPLFFLDYFATGTLSEDVLPAVLAGFAQACRENGCALLGGETAEMPGVYAPGEFDLAGTIVGRVLPEGRHRRLEDRRRRPGLGPALNRPAHQRLLPGPRGAAGQGRPRARRPPDELGGATVGDALLAVHKSYLPDVRAIWEAHGREAVHGLAHITGGGFYDNIPRVVPDGLCVHVDPTAWKPLPIFDLIAAEGEVDRAEMYRVFNMGIGLVRRHPGRRWIWPLPRPRRRAHGRGHRRRPGRWTCGCLTGPCPLSGVFAPGITPPDKRLRAAAAPVS